MAVDLTIASTVVTLSIILSGILLGVGKTIGSKKIEFFGAEELLQSVINAALVGAYAGIVEIATSLSNEIAEVSQCMDGDALENLACTFHQVSIEMFKVIGGLFILTNMVGYYQTLTLEFASFSIQPLVNLSSVAGIFGLQLIIMQQLLTISEFNYQLINFFGPQLLSLFLPLGLVFRSFFPTRRLGGFLIALAVGIYLFFPFMVLIFPTPIPMLEQTGNMIENITNNSNYATVPIVDLNGSGAIGEKIDNLTKGDFTGDLAMSIESVSQSISSATLYVLFAPLFGLLITIIFIKEITDILGGEFFFAVGNL